MPTSSRPITLFLAAALTGGCLGDPPPPPDPSSTAATARERTRRFRFLERTDPAAVALTDLYVAERMSPTTQAEVEARRLRAAAGRDGLAANARAAATLLLDDLAERDPDELDPAAHAVLFDLLARTGDPRAAAHLATWVARPRPARLPSSRGREHGADPADALLDVQAAALHALGQLSPRGDATARAALLDVAAVDPALRRIAVTYYLRGRGDRFRARRELAARLPATERHLVHQVLF